MGALKGNKGPSAKRRKTLKKIAARENRLAAEAAQEAEKQTAALVDVATQEAPEIVIPPLPEPERMPAEIDPGVRQARKRIASRKRGTGGRLSTILTG